MSIATASTSAQGHRLRVLLVGKHELACRLLALLRDEPRVQVGIVPARSEVARDGRETLTGALRAGDQVVPDDGRVALADAVRTFRPAVVVSAGFDRIVKAEVLDAIPNPVNIHFGRLPRYRGSFSIPWAIMNDDDVIGITVHRMAPSIDDGPIHLQATIPNDRGSSCRVLYLQAVERGAALFRQYLDLVLTTAAVPAIPQDELAATYYPPEYPGDFRVPWKQMTTYVRNYIRAASFVPLPGAHTSVDDTAFEIEWPVDERFGDPRLAPGTIVSCDGRDWIATLNGLIGPRLVRHAGGEEAFANFVDRRRLAGKRCT